MPVKLTGYEPLSSFQTWKPDARNSPTGPVVKAFRKAGELAVHDPYVKEVEGVKATRSLREALEDADVAIFMVSHKEYQRLSPKTMKKLMRTPIVVDGRDIFSATKMSKAGFRYLGVGKKLSD